MRPAIGALLLIAAACGGGGGGGGDGDAMPSDGAGSGASCTIGPDTCTGDDVCVRGTCTPAFPLPYRVTAFKIHVPAGFTHDTDGKPDLQPHVATGEPSPLMDVTPIPVSKDVFDLNLPGPFDLTLMSSNSSLMVGVDDADPTSPMTILDCLDAPVTVTMLRAGGDSCANGPATISFSIAPK